MGVPTGAAAPTADTNNALFRASPIGILSGQRLNPRSRAQLQAFTERIAAGDRENRGSFNTSITGRRLGGRSAQPFNLLGRQSELQAQFTAEDLERANKNQTLLGQISQRFRTSSLL